MQNYARIFTTSGTFILALLQTAVLLAGPYDPPAGYYSSATGTGSTLKSQLHNIIDNHTVYSYDAARSILQDTDQDPNDPDSILLVYDRESLDVLGHQPGRLDPGLGLRCLVEPRAYLAQVARGRRIRPPTPATSTSFARPIPM